MPGDPYLSINPKFAVLPAVPGVKTPVQLKERLPKKILPGKEASVLIPARFMPLPAVPVEDTAGDIGLIQKVADVSNTVEEDLEEKVQEGKDEEEISSNVAPVKAVLSAPGPSDARRA